MGGLGMIIAWLQSFDSRQNRSCVVQSGVIWVWDAKGSSRGTLFSNHVDFVDVGILLDTASTNRRDARFFKKG